MYLQYVERQMDLNQQVKKKNRQKIAAILQNLVQLSQQPFVGVMERVCCIIISTDAHVSGVSSRASFASAAGV